MARIDDQIDELFKGPLEAFTSGRNDLAKTAGPQHASRVRRLRKPTRVAWTVNQLYWRDKRTLERLMSAGRQLRKAQLAALAKRTSDLRGAVEAHRRALGEAVRSAERLAEGGGHRVDADVLSRTLDALSLVETPSEVPGRLTQPMSPTGFDVLASAATRPGRARRRS